MAITVMVSAPSVLFLERDTPKEGPILTAGTRDRISAIQERERHCGHCSGQTDPGEYGKEGSERHTAEIPGEANCETLGVEGVQQVADLLRAHGRVTHPALVVDAISIATPDARSLEVTRLYEVRENAVRLPFG
jgi:hypothetical protein